MQISSRSTQLKKGSDAAVGEPDRVVVDDGDAADAAGGVVEGAEGAAAVGGEDDVFTAAGAVVAAAGVAVAALVARNDAIAADGGLAHATNADALTANSAIGSDSEGGAIVVEASIQRHAAALKTAETFWAVGAHAAGQRCGGQRGVETASQRQRRDSEQERAEDR